MNQTDLGLHCLLRTVRCRRNDTNQTDLGLHCLLRTVRCRRNDTNQTDLGLHCLLRTVSPSNYNLYSAKLSELNF